MKPGVSPLIISAIIVSIAVLLGMAAMKPIEGNKAVEGINAVAVRYVPDALGMELRPSAFVVGLRIAESQGADVVAARQFAEPWRPQSMLLQKLWAGL
ncbi:MAG: hypothetical protein NXY59_10510 [Aigarchaeota archaeon]|nr:hypothetical protein [Candidatus Pelearchaeum maunauluense]